MYFYRNISEDVVYVGASDRRTARFENMFELPWGICYNSYLIIDGDKTCLMDGVDQSIAERYDRDVAQALDGRKLDYFVIQHVEPDHCSTINSIMRQHPETKMIITQPGLKLMKQFYNVDYTDRAIIAKDNLKIELNKHTLEFILAPNVHWPEVMMTYDHYDKALYTADAFGSFKAQDGHLFADQVNYERDWMDEARRYYINIVGKQGPHVQRLFAKIEKNGFEIENIRPLHGLIFRTKETIDMIMEKYHLWSTYTPEEKGVTLVCGSMYNNTMETMEYLSNMLADKGVPNIRLYDISEIDRSFAMADMFRYSHVVFGCPTYNTELFPQMDAFLRDAIALNFCNRKVAFIENRSWGGKALKIAQEILGQAKDIEFIDKTFNMTSTIHSHQLDGLNELADAIVASLELEQ